MKHEQKITPYCFKSLIFRGCLLLLATLNPFWFIGRSELIQTLKQRMTWEGWGSRDIQIGKLLQGGERGKGGDEEKGKETIINTLTIPSLHHPTSYNTELPKRSLSCLLNLFTSTPPCAFIPIRLFPIPLTKSSNCVVTPSSHGPFFQYNRWDCMKERNQVYFLDPLSPLLPSITSEKSPKLHSFLFFLNDF